MSWYDFCVAYVDMKWKHSAAKRQATIAWALVTVMPPMLATSKGAPDPKAMRRALRQWGFNTGRRDQAPEDALGDPGRTTPPNLAPLRATASGTKKLRRVFDVDTRRRPASAVNSRKNKNATPKAPSLTGWRFHGSVREPLYGIEP
jgi:hypothetical protein